MCVGLKVDENTIRRADLAALENGNAVKKGANEDQRKEKAKNAARERRTQESDYFDELEEMLPVSALAPSSQQSSLDKTSVIRLSVANLKIRDVITRAVTRAEDETKVDTMIAEVDTLACVEGFSVVLGSNLDIIYVSENVTNYIGLSQVELVGQDVIDYVHPCDHQELKKLVPVLKAGAQEHHVEIFVRVKCTVTERGRMINLKQANYKPLKISGKARVMPVSDQGGVQGTVFMGLASHVLDREVSLEQGRLIVSKHSVDMKYTDTPAWMTTVAGYTSTHLIGASFFDLVHSADAQPVLMAFKNLKEHGQCETPLYRLLCGGGGWCWVQTRASIATARRGSSKPSSVTCITTQISEVQNKDQILGLIQMKETPVKQETPVTVIMPAEDLEEVKVEEVKPLQPQSVLRQQPQLPRCHPPPQRVSVISRTPTPVIVKPRKVEPRATTEMFFSQQPPQKMEPRPVAEQLFGRPPPKPMTEMFFAPPKPAPKATTEMMFAPAQPKVVTELLFAPPKPAPKAVTESLFSCPQVVSPWAVEPKAVTGLLFAPAPVEEKTTKVPNEATAAAAEKDFFDELLSNLDQIEDLECLAPHAGDHCIPLTELKTPVAESPVKKTAPALIESLSFEDLIKDLGEDEAGAKDDMFLHPEQHLVLNESPEQQPKKPRMEEEEAGPGAPQVMSGDIWEELFDTALVQTPATQEQEAPLSPEIVCRDISYKCGQRIPGQEILQVPKASSGVLIDENSQNPPKKLKFFIEIL